MSYTQKILDYIIKNEGGYVDNHLDKGGPTKYGITIGTLSKYLSQQVSAIAVKSLTLEVAEQIYVTNYLKPCGCDKLVNLAIATTLADTAVLYSVEMAIKTAQKACNTFNYGLEVDGDAGINTVDALNSIEPKKFVERFHSLLLMHIAAIVINNPSQSVFQNGWRNRADKILTLV